MFDRILIVDWSAANQPRQGRDSIWIGDGTAPPVNPPTRVQAMARLHAEIAQARSRGHRLLIGADFAFGYPTGFARALTGRDGALAVWDWLADAVQDGPDNRSNRIAVAAAINARLPGLGPFWFNPLRQDMPDLPRKGTERHGHGFADKRVSDHAAPGAQSVWKLGGVGAVGSQTLTGIAALERLRRAFPGQIAVWPIQPPDAPVVLAEVFPSLLAPQIAAASSPGVVRDAVQVTLLARALSRLNVVKALAPLFSVPDDPAVADEGWILGLGFQESLAASLVD